MIVISKKVRRGGGDVRGRVRGYGGRGRGVSLMSCQAAYRHYVCIFNSVC